MNSAARGVVIRIRPYSDTSLIVHWLTADAGRLATMARGARRPKSAFFGRLDLLVEADFSYIRSRRSDLHALGEVSVRSRFGGVDVASLELAAVAVSELEAGAESDTPLDGVFDLFMQFLAGLKTGGAKPRWLLAWEARFLQELGLDPRAEAESLSEGAQALLNDLSEAPWEQLDSLQPEATAVRSAARFLGGCFLRHLGREPKGRSKIFSGASEVRPRT